MPRQKGTLSNFMGDNEITQRDIQWCIHTGKVAVGKERTQIIDRSQLIAWGLIKEVVE